MLRTDSTSAPTIGAASPFFIAADLPRSLAFYRDQLGFEVTFLEAPEDPFFAIVRRGGAQLFLKTVSADVAPLPNSRRHRDARWDAYAFVPDPDALAAEFAAREVAFSVPLMDTHDGLRGFELADPDGYVWFFGRPR